MVVTRESVVVCQLDIPAPRFLSGLKTLKNSAGVRVPADGAAAIVRRDQFAAVSAVTQQRNKIGLAVMQAWVSLPGTPKAHPAKAHACADGQRIAEQVAGLCAGLSWR